MTSLKGGRPWLPVVVGVAAVTAAGVYLARTRRDDLLALGTQLVLERPVAGQSYPALAQGLERDGEAFSAYLNTVPDTAANRGQLGHIIGIEGWGQARLEAVMNGSEPPTDEHGPYKPDVTLSLPELTAVFAQTRAKTAALARQLGLHPPEHGVRIRHKQWGPLSARGWLNYLAIHARREGRDIRAG